MRAVVGLTLSAFAMLLFSPSATRACSCVKTLSPCQEFQSAGAVFVGKAVGFTDTPFEEEIRGKKFTYQERTYRFLVQESLRGIKDAEVQVETGRTDSSCHVEFKVGESYIVYAGRDSRGQLGVGFCNRAVRWTHGEVDLLRAVLNGTTESSVYGSVERWAYDFLENRSMSMLGPVSGVKIVVEGNGRVFEAVTDEGGQYKIASLPEGKYRVTAHLRKPFDPASREVEIGKGGCGTEASFGAVLNGEIKGRVLDMQGRPVAHARLMLMPADRASEEDRPKSVMWYGTDKDGNYVYHTLPPGRYVLAASVEGPPIPKMTYSRVYYPDALRLVDAAAIAVGEGEAVEGIDIKIPWLKVRRIEGNIVWSDGSPVTNGWVSLYKSENSPEGPDERYAQINADRQGRFKLQVIEGAEYWVRAYGYSPDKEYRRINARPMMLTSGDFDQPLRIVVPLPKGH